LVAPYEK